MNQNLKLIYYAKGRLEGEMIKAFLEAHGIPAVISQEAAGSVYGLTVGDLGAAEIFVNRSDEANARSLLAEMERGEFLNEQLVDENSNGSVLLGPQSQPDEIELQNRKHVLFLCTQNSARSQLAEAVANHFCWDEWVAVSAGIEPEKSINPYALAVLAEAGIFHQGEPKPVDDFYGQDFDLIVTVCEKIREQCPIWLAKEKIIHIGFEDPAAVEGSEQVKMEAFRKTLRLIIATIPPLLEQHESAI